MVDLSGRRATAEATFVGDPALVRRARRVARSEAAALRRADAVLAVSDVEQAMIESLAPGVPCRLAPTHYRVRSGPPFGERVGIAFIGGFRHAPNVDAARWLVEDLWPNIAAELPESAALTIVGEEPPVWLRRASGPRVRVVGAVTDLDGLLDSVRLTIAPLRWGAGLKGKVHASLAAGVPCVGTTVAVEGFGATPGVHLLVGDSAAGLVSAATLLHEDPLRWEGLSRAGRELVVERYPASRLVDSVATLLPTGPQRK
jgi:glycosyltransferase involved in cell wall biosynthesis